MGRNTLFKVNPIYIIDYSAAQYLHMYVLVCLPMLHVQLPAQFHHAEWAPPKFEHQLHRYVVDNPDQQGYCQQQTENL